ncbi:hypothetical protein [Pseudothauera rhizosphaerae]|uniref:Uncharacterized protein n=1 Tax=Pseudothauera rhizosphaerae TaxID=2565932 RepID=A0A4S4AB56_9RHOO|nr:hypothetical protein [Pseudothauera rhizosphaerae]THF56178.1 hypothetical protein E6O51_19450 [Pseudothauera rhizosphaerae]
MMDKLLRIFLAAAGQRAGHALNNPNLAQRFGFVAAQDAWMGMRRLRNRLVHDYVANPAEPATALAKAREFDCQSRCHLGLRYKEFAARNACMIEPCSVGSNGIHPF